jgi:hypothetical protein
MAVAQVFVGSGDLYVNRLDPATGLSLGLAGPFECEKFAVKSNTEIKEKTSKGRSTYGQVIGSVALQKPAEIEITLSQTGKDGMTMALLGTASALSQGSGSITDEVIVAKRDYWVQLSKQAFAVAGFSVKHTSGTPTYVLGTDYLVNYQLGMVKVLSTGAILEGASIKVSGTYVAITGTKISGATQAQVRGAFLLDGQNFADSNACIVRVPQAVLSSGDVFDFLSDNFGTVPLKGKMETPLGASEPFTVELRGVS